MITKDSVQVGDAVHYQPDHYLAEDKFENGIVKEVPEQTISSIRVVYNCGGDWGNYKEYTSALTDCRDLNKGWR